MALVIEANYSKKVGLPGYSSHQFSLTLKAEITDINQVPAESARLYRLLQDGVDTSIQQVGWLPEAKPTNGNGNGNGHTNGNPPSHPRNGNGNGQPTNGNHEQWNCTPKQQDLIIKIVDDNRLDKAEVEKLAMDRFGKGVRQLNKLEASGFIEELFERNPRQRVSGRFKLIRPWRLLFSFFGVGFQVFSKSFSPGLGTAPQTAVHSVRLIVSFQSRSVRDHSALLLPRLPYGPRHVSDSFGPSSGLFRRGEGTGPGWRWLPEHRSAISPTLRPDDWRSSWWSGSHNGA